MATLTKTEINVYSNAAGTTQVGSTYNHSGSGTSIPVDDAALGGEELIQPGENYWVKARVTDSANRVSYWTPLYKVTTTPYMEVTPVSAADGVGARVYLQATYNPDAINLESSGFLVSDDPDFTYFEVYDLTPGDILEISLYKETTDYFFLPWCKYNGGKYWQPPVEEAPCITTDYFAPNVSFINMDTSYNYIEGTLNIVADNPDLPITAVWIMLYDDDNHLLNRIQMLGQLGQHNFIFEDGVLDSDSHPITVSPDTTYVVVGLVGYPNSSVRINTTLTTDEAPNAAIYLSTSNVTSSTASVGWLVEGNSVETPTISVHISGAGHDYYPTCPSEYGQRWVNLAGLQSGTTYTVTGTVSLDSGSTDTQTITFTTL